MLWILRHRSERTGIRPVTVAMGTTFVVLMVCVDPGSVASGTTDRLVLWLVVSAGALAVFVRYRWVPLGVATGRGLTRPYREYYGRTVDRLSWVRPDSVTPAEFATAMMASNPLFGVLLLGGALIAAVDGALVATALLVAVLLGDVVAARRIPSPGVHPAPTLVRCGLGAAADAHGPAGHRGCPGPRRAEQRHRAGGGRRAARHRWRRATGGGARRARRRVRIGRRAGGRAGAHVRAQPLVPVSGLGLFLVGWGVTV